MSTAQDHVLDGDVKLGGDAASTNAADILSISSKEPGLVLIQETSDTDSSASVYSSDQQMPMKPKMTLATETPCAEVIFNKVEKTVPLSEEMQASGNGGEVKWSSESMKRELAEAKAENAKLRADLEKERAEKKLSASSQDDPFAPREGKTLVWTGVTMTLVRSKSLFFEDSTRFDTSLTMHLISFFICLFVPDTTASERQKT